MAAFNNVIQWYENKALDEPKLRSPTPCPRGVYCQYKLPNKETKELELACCRMVHPGEEGNGRRLFPARTAPDGREQPACVRLTGNALFYERCRLKQPWRIWATEHGIPLPPTDVPWVQVERGPIRRTPQEEINELSRRVMRMRIRPAGGNDLQERVADILATQQMARASLEMSRAGGGTSAAATRAAATSAAATSAAATSAAATSAAATSAADWPALPYRVPQVPPRLDLTTAVPTVPVPINLNREQVTSPRLCMPPPRLNLSGVGGNTNYGFNVPPPIQRLRAERMYEGSEASPTLLGSGTLSWPAEGGCATPSLLGSVNEDECATPRLAPIRTRADRVQERVQAYCDKGMSFEDALYKASSEVHAEIVAEAAEGGMEALD